MRANPNTSELSTLKIAGASVLGLALSFGFTSQQGHGGAVFSLFNEGNLFRDSGALLFFRLAVFACLLLLPFQRRLFAIMGTFILVSWVVLYSFVGAFIFPLITSCAFFYFAFRQSRAELKAGAALMLALPFLLSAIHKMHPGYLRGTEFSNGGSFFMFLYSWGFRRQFSHKTFQKHLLRHLWLSNSVFLSGCSTEPRCSPTLRFSSPSLWQSRTHQFCLFTDSFSPSRCSSTMTGRTI